MRISYIYVYIYIHTSIHRNLHRCIIHIYIYIERTEQFYLKQESFVNLSQSESNIIVTSLECNELTPAAWEFIMTSCDVGHPNQGWVYSTVSGAKKGAKLSHRCGFQAVGVKCNPHHEVLYHPYPWAFCCEAVIGNWKSMQDFDNFLGKADSRFVEWQGFLLINATLR